MIVQRTYSVYIQLCTVVRLSTLTFVFVLGRGIVLILATGHKMRPLEATSLAQVDWGGSLQTCEVFKIMKRDNYSPSDRRYPGSG